MANLDPFIEFASRYGDAYHSTLTAAAAIWRLEALASDLEDLQSSNPKPDYKEIISYYLVAATTCIEWHAKARLNDMFTFNPSLITTQDIDNAKINSKRSAAAIANNITVSQLITSSIRVSSLDNYSNIINRVLLSINSNLSIATLFSGKENETVSILEEIRYIMDFRNKIVHEINEEFIGHRTFRALFSIEQMKSYIEITLRMIKEIENVITKFAPISFPNLLDRDLNSVEKSEILSTKIKNAEDRILYLFSQEFESDEFKSDRKDFIMQISKSRDNTKSELDLIENSGILHNRYVNYRMELKLIFLECRLRYIERMLYEVEQISPDGTGPQRLSTPY